MPLIHVRMLLVSALWFFCGLPTVKAARPWSLGFDQEPVDTRFAHNRSAVLNCSPKGHPTPSVTWRYARDKQKLITTNITLRYILPNGSLYFPPFSKENFDPSIHQADYECLAKNVAGEIVSKIARLRAVIVQHYTVYTADARVVEGSTALIRCVVPDAVLPYVCVKSWRQREEILTLGGRFFAMPSGDLVISNVNLEDTQKMFLCTTVNILTGEKRSSNPAKVFLEKADQNVVPKMTSLAHNVSVDVGETAELQCTAQGSRVQYTWSKDGSQVQIGGRFFKYAGESLRIKPTKYEDNGVYLCTASNSVGSVSMAISLSVRDPLKFKVRPVSKSAKVRQGGVDLECGITGRPIPEVTWYKDAKPLLLNDRITLTPLYDARNSRWDFNLSFKDVINEDSGTYQCFADNGVDIIHSSASFIRDGKIPTISTNLPTVFLDLNQPLRLSCQASAIVTPDITWEFDGESLVDGVDGYKTSDEMVTTTGSTGVESAKNSTLSHPMVGVKNNGKYKCGACSVVGCSTKEIVVHVRGPPEITYITSRINVINTQSAHLHCVVKGYPAPKVTWSNAGKDPRHTVYINNTLVISRIRELDRGQKYRCTANNSLGQDSKVATLNVLEPPDLRLTLMKDLVAGSKESAILSCTVSSTKSCNVTWKKDGVNIHSSDRLEIDRLQNNELNFLTFKQVDTTQAGKYTCIAASVDGSTEVSKEITVYVPPRFTEEPAAQQVLRTYTASLTCKATGSPPPRIDWSKQTGDGSNPVQYSTRVEKMLNGTLLIRNVTDADKGLYFCTAVSLKGTSINSNVLLSVHEVPAKINTAPENKSGKVSTFVTVRCVAYGNLPIDVRWYNGSTQMKNNSRITMKTMPATESYQVIGTLIVRNLVLQDTGSYRCRVKNSLGADTKTFQITAQDKPSPPSKPGVKHRGPRSLDIVWNARFDGNSPITDFIVEYKLEKAWMTEMVAGSTNEFKLTSLKPASFYRLRIRAKNALGTGNAGDETRVTTKEDAPSGPPNIINITAKSSTEILVKWQPPPEEQRNGIILGYFIVVKEANKVKLTTNTTVRGGSSDNFVIGGLKPWKEYNVLMQAFTKAGVGPKTKKRNSVKTKEGVPSKPPHTITVQTMSSTKIEVKWDPPTTDSLNGELQGYKVRYYKVFEPRDKSEKKTEYGTSMVLSGLAKFTAYKISVLAYTRAGDGVTSGETEVTTEEDVPGPLHNVRAVPVSRAVIRVLWKLPLEPNGIIREYTVKYSLDPSGEKGGKSVQVLGNCSFKELPLQANTEYYFWVKAKTSKGYGNVSKVVKRRTEDKIAANIFDKELPTVFAKRSGSAVLNCEAYGDPKPTIRWERGNRHLSETSKYEQLKNGSLKVLQLQKADGGEYTCTASNNLDTKKVTRKLKVQVPPGPPTNIVIKTLPSNTAVNITWTPGFDGNSPVSEFLLEFQSKDGEWAPVRVSHSQRYYVHSVQTDGVQHFRMSAINEIGQGTRSKVYKITRKLEVINVEELNPEDEVGIPERRTFYHNPAILGTLIGVSVLVVVVLVFFSLLAYRGGHIDLKKISDWRQQIFGKSTQRRNGRGHGNQAGERPPTSVPTTASLCTLERLPTPDGSEISIAGSNYPLPFCYPHDTILEEDFVSLPPPYQSVTRLRSSLISHHAPADDSNSDTSSEISYSRPVYHRATLHTNEATARTRRYMVSAEHRASVHRSIRSLGDTSRVSSLGYRGHADGRSELDTSFSKSLELSNPELRYYSTARPMKIHGPLSHESIPNVYVRSPASMARDSGLGPSEFGQSSTHSRRSSNSSQVTPLARPTPSPMRRDSASSRESSSVPVNGNKLSASRDRKAYDSTSSECSSSRDELMAALEFGKRHNLDKYYGIPTLETTSASSETTNTSSDLEGVCRFSASPRLSGHGCLAPVPMRPPPFNPRSRSRVNENYMYVLDPRRINRDTAYGRPHNGSLV